jgi:hypothetical protein
MLVTGEDDRHRFWEQPLLPSVFQIHIYRGDDYLGRPRAEPSAR